MAFIWIINHAFFFVLSAIFISKTAFWILKNIWNETWKNVRDLTTGEEEAVIKVEPGVENTVSGVGTVQLALHFSLDGWNNNKDVVTNHFKQGGMVPINSQSMLFCLNTSFDILAHALCSPCLKNHLKTSCCQIIFHIQNSNLTYAVKEHETIWLNIFAFPI